MPLRLHSRARVLQFAVGWEVWGDILGFQNLGILKLFISSAARIWLRECVCHKEKSQTRRVSHERRPQIKASTRNAGGEVAERKSRIICICVGRLLIGYSIKILTVIYWARPFKTFPAMEVVAGAVFLIRFPSFSNFRRWHAQAISSQSYVA